MMSKLTSHCQREDEMVRERTGHPPSYAKAKKMKPLALHNYGCSRASLGDFYSSSSYPMHHRQSSPELSLIGRLRS